MLEITVVMSRAEKLCSELYQHEFLLYPIANFSYPILG